MPLRSIALAAASLSLTLGCGGSASSGGGGSGGTGGGTSSATTSTGDATTTTTSATTTSTTTSSTSSSGTGGMGACGADPSMPNDVLPDATDPEMGMFGLDKALAGLPDGPGPLRAIIDTDLGTLTCTLEDQKVPNGVANFVGLARGTRAWKDPKLKKWVRRRFYDGLTFHRVIPMFVAQGGDPLGTGTGGPGYQFPDELVGLHHIPGTLAYANSGPNSNGSQFYVTETEQTQLDKAYTIFGFCTPVSVVVKLTGVPTNAQDKPLTPLHMKTVTITRCAP
jgi:peptidyl-prolyl cis-trans isomerase A (cyclophilin A)